MSGQTITGVRHVREDGRECVCGCQFVEGLEGTIVEDRPDLDLIVGQFWVPYSLDGRQLRRVAFSSAELGRRARKGVG